MTSVTSLDKDLKRLRLSKYTPQAAKEVRTWIEDILAETLGDGDLLDRLRDGIVLCKLANAAVPSPGVKYKASKMPFVQRENISHFLRAVQSPPLSLPDHDVFSTVDLYESKDPAQVLQCLSAFSRRANHVQPSRFPRTLGPKSRTGALTPQGTGGSEGWKSPGRGSRTRGFSSASQSSASNSAIGNARSSDSAVLDANDQSRTSPRGGVSTWSKKTDEACTTPAWNIHQYGYLGGASQASQGVSFGGTRQITGSAPVAESLAERERRRQEQQAAQEKLRLEREEAERRALAEREAEEERARAAEERRWKEETRRRLERERQEAEAEKARWEEEEGRWREEEDRREKAERERQARTDTENAQPPTGQETRLNGQFLSQYLLEQTSATDADRGSKASDVERERERVRQVERQLEMAKAREEHYEMERRRHMRLRSGHDGGDGQRTSEVVELLSRRSATVAQGPTQAKTAPPVPRRLEKGSDEDERLQLREEWNAHRTGSASLPSPSPEPAPVSARPLPIPGSPANKADAPPAPRRPLPDPAAYAPNGSRVDRFLGSNPAPARPKPDSHVANELGFDSAAERHGEDARREQSQSKTKAGGWASKSLLEREMELERQRQAEWEEAQSAPRQAVPPSKGAGTTLSSTGSRRQIIGPRPPP